ncbi:right-handed parallel beta-helix repeat-containing protein [Pantoea agglomerans]|uniref:right-handed parallel beta-helix repeat-containing protein n=1 Tax=Enterobacter agglomerans TaxID=549 RepID=UPI001F3A57AE|nr:right-handed parallel beta-helix repeat-containing protein [Pantoea agglomerans]UJL36136.1 right-handed parallel beta-helix repeat-containing protein [Pantoea agglomerans]
MPITLTDCDISDNGAGGIFIGDGIKATISGGSINNNGGNGLHIEGTGDGVTVDKVLISHNEKIGVLIIPPVSELMKIGFLPDTPIEVINEAMETVKKLKDKPIVQVTEALQSSSIEKYLTKTAEIATIAAFFMPYV